ncbi:hypothetical protein ES707_22697 [subsurface metagenome]
MKIDLSYAEMSFLRELVGKEKMEIWKSRWRHSTKGMSIKDINEMMDRIFKNPTYHDSEIEPPVFTDETCIGRLLHKFDKYEKIIQSELKKETP